MKIAIGCDHGGFILKPAVIELLKEKNIEYVDFGVNNGETKDYPDIARPVCESVANCDCHLGILMCGTGIGMAIAANKIKGIRAANCFDTFCAQMARQHNNANIITLGGRVTAPKEAKEILKAFLDAGFEGGRHAARVDKIMSLE